MFFALFVVVSNQDCCVIASGFVTCFSLLYSLYYLLLLVPNTVVLLFIYLCLPLVFLVVLYLIVLLLGLHYSLMF